jgi:hypothetical protein
MLRDVLIALRVTPLLPGDARLQVNEAVLEGEKRGAPGARPKDLMAFERVRSASGRKKTRYGAPGLEAAIEALRAGIAPFQVFRGALGRRRVMGEFAVEDDLFVFQERIQTAT